MKGTYIIVIRLLNDSKIKVGSLGRLDFLQGYYLYIGSAMGNKGSTTLENRVKRHILISNKKRTHWHIDYLLINKSSRITHIYLIPSLSRLECIISEEISRRSDNSVSNFGSSDCACLSHLYFFQEFVDLIHKSKSF
ncbi:MAG: GIY-YIG nuclease family protein [Promethearchaeota archaeon]|jgi:Uri superfamily endonuclease